jgi:HEAT repeat protein
MSGSAGLGVVTLDRALTIQSWNEWLASATGLPEGDARGRTLLSLVAAERAEIIRAFLDEVLSSGTSRVLAPAFHRYLIACPPREPARHFSEMQQFVTIAPLATGSTIAGVIVTIEDVTPQLDHQRDLAARIEAASPGEIPHGTIEAVGAPDWQLRGAAVRNLRQRASTAEIAHLLEALQRGYHDLNVVSSALQVLAAANRDVTSPLVDLLSAPQPDLRMHAALALGKVGDPSAVPALVKALDDQDANVRFHAIEALGAVGSAEAVERLAEIARSGDFFLSFPAVDALARSEDPRVGPALISLLDDDLLRPAVIEALASVADEDAVEPLAALLNRGGDDDTVASVAAALERIRAREEETFGAGAHIVDLARGAITALGAAALASAVERKRQPLASLVAVLGWTRSRGVHAIVGVLGDASVDAVASDALMAIGAAAVEPLLRRLPNADRGAAMTVVALLGALGDLRAVAPLKALLDSADAELVAAAAAALASLGEPSALESLLALFGHEQAIVRQTAIAAVNSIGADATGARIRTRLEDADARVRACAVRVAGYFGFESAIPGVLRALEDADEDVRRAAIEQLPVIDDARAAPRLIDALRRETPRNRAAAAHALRLVDASVAAVPLVGALGDADAWVRYFAATAAGQRRIADAVPALTRLAADDPAPHVRIAAIGALASIDPSVAGEISAPLVSDPDRDVASAALAALAGGSHPRADDLLEHAVKSGDAALGRAAVRALPLRASPRAAATLAWAARLEEPRDLSRLAVEALGQLASSGGAAARHAAIGVLLELASAPDVRDAALRVAATLPDGVVDDVATHLHAPRAATRLAVVEALARMRNPRASEALGAALADDDPRVRQAAVTAFGRLGTTSAATAVADLSTFDPDAGVRRVAAAMCRRRGWRGGDPR